MQSDNCVSVWRGYELILVCVKICRFPPSVFADKQREKAAGIIALFQGFCASYGGKKTGAKWQFFAHTSKIKAVAVFLLALSLPVLFGCSSCGNVCDGGVTDGETYYDEKEDDSADENVAAENEGDSVAEERISDVSAFLGGLHNLDGVIFSTEHKYYAEGTANILTFWDNNSESSISIAHLFYLEKYDPLQDVWNIVMRDKESFGYHAIRFLVPVGSRREYTIPIHFYDDSITEGSYRIWGAYTVRHWGNSAHEPYVAIAEFSVTQEESLLG